MDACSPGACCARPGAIGSNASGVSGIWRLGTAFGPFACPGNFRVGFATSETSRFARLFRNVRPPHSHHIDGPQRSRCSAEGLPRVQGYGTTRRYTGRIRAWGNRVPAVLPVFCFLSPQSPVPSFQFCAGCRSLYAGGVAADSPGSCAARTRGTGYPLGIRTPAGVRRLGRLQPLPG
jgi:hypothetical protein